MAEPTPPPGDPQLRERIARLEQRVASLEAYARSMHEWASARQAATAPPAQPQSASSPPAVRPVEPHAAEATHPPAAIPPRAVPQQRTPAPRWAPSAALDATPAARQAPKDAPAQFLTDEEFAARLTANEATPRLSQRLSTMGAENLLRYAFLLAGGGFLVLAGTAVAVLASGTMAPWLRVGLGGLVSAAVVGGGLFVRRRNESGGRLGVAIGLAIGYFTAFASHFAEPMRVLPMAWPSLGLMAALAAVLVVLAERWRSESMAATGFLLGVLGALLVAPESQAYALVSLVVLAAAAGVLLVRNEWSRLNALAVAGAYAGTALLWVVAPPGSEPGAVLAHFGALAAYYAAFSAAFLKWGRKWVAREQAAAHAPEAFGTPEVRIGSPPYSVAFSIVNSLAFSALSVALLWRTGAFLDRAEWLLAGIAAVEASRLALPRLRRAGLGQFHAIHAFVLAASAAAVAFAGLAEAMVLAAMTLAVAVASTRAPVLRWLRPLGVLTAALAVPAFLDELPFTGTENALGALAGLMLIASALPWHRLGARTPDEGRPLRILEFLSASARAFIASVLLFVLVVEAPTSDPTDAALVALLAAAALTGLIAARAHAWIPTAVFLSIMAMLASHQVLDDDLLKGTAMLMLLVAGSAAWTLAHQGAPGRLLRAAYGLAALAVSAGWVLMLLDAWEGFLGFHGLWLVGGGAGAIAAHAAARRIGTRAASGLEGPAATAESFLRVGVASGGVLVASGLAASSFGDPRHFIGSPLIVTGALLGAWAAGSKLRIPAPAREALPALALLVFGAGMLTGLESSGLAIALFAAAAIAMLEAARPAKSNGLVAAGGVGLFVLAPVVLGAWGAQALTATGAILAMAASAAAIPAAYRFAAIGSALLPEVDGWRKAPLAAAPAFALVLLALATTPGLLPGLLVTGAWAVLGFVLFGLGIALRRAELRFTAFGVFAAAGARLLVHDLAGRDWLTIAVAAAIVGALMVAAMLAAFYLAPAKPSKSQEP